MEIRRFSRRAAWAADPLVVHVTRRAQGQRQMLDHSIRMSAMAAAGMIAPG
jgi:hypothetical protein